MTHIGNRGTPCGDARPWRPEDGDTRCQDCGHVNVIWYADNETWNRVAGTINNPCGDGVIVCPSCFIRRAEVSGIVGVWLLSNSLHEGSVS